MDWKSFWERLIGKLTSGRFIFTLVTAGTFCYLAVTGILPLDKVQEIILIVVYAYFSKPRPDVNSTNNNDKNNSGPKL
jgi:hypothetical protein